LLDAIRSFDAKWLRAIVTLQGREILARPHFHFVIPLLTGIAFALFFFTRIIPLPVYLHTYPELVYGLFFGLILASIYILMKEINRFKWSDLIWLCMGAAAGLFVVTLVPMDTPNDTWFIFLCGFVAISAMVLPGISGSFILLILKKYAYILGALGTLDFAVLLPFVAGLIVGITSFTRLLSWLLRHYYRNMILLIKGILLASLWVIWPFQERVFVVVREKQRLISSTPVLPRQLDQTVLLAAAFAVTGIVLVIVIHWLAQRKLTSKV
jgi:putative membrane protein